MASKNLEGHLSNLGMVSCQASDTVVARNGLEALRPLLSTPELIVAFQAFHAMG